ncbi:MAG: diguanylate cyclase [Chloroflexi bacterium]|nr:diguanylate cyclase [Chloroflexota bacterium]
MTLRPQAKIPVMSLLFYAVYCAAWVFLFSQIPFYIESAILLLALPVVLLIAWQPLKIVAAGIGLFFASLAITFIWLIPVSMQAAGKIGLLVFSVCLLWAVQYYLMARKGPLFFQESKITALKQIAQHETILGMIENLVQWLLKSGDWHTDIEEVLSTVGQLTRAGRVYVFENYLDPTRGFLARWKYEWTEPASSARVDEPLLQNYSFQENELSHWATLLSQNHPVRSHTRDLAEVPRKRFAEHGVFSVLIVPIFVNGQWWGGIGLDECEGERVWNASEVHILRIAANLLGAVIERQESDRLVKNLLQQERHLREVFQTLSEVGASILATHELEPLLDMLLEQMRRVIEYDSASILLRYGGKVRISRSVGRLGKKFRPVYVKNGLEFDIESTRNLREMFESKKPLIIPDTQEYDWLFVEGVEYIRSFAGAPILVQDEVVAFLTLDKAEPNFYQPEYLELLSIFSSYAGLALQNARYLESASRRVEESETLRKASSLVASELDLEQVLKEILIQLEKVVPYDSASVFLATHEGLKIMAGRYLPNNNAIIGQTLPIEDKLFQEISNTNSALILEDAQQDNRFLKFGNTDYIRGWMGLPMFLRGQIIGYLSIDNRTPGAYSLESANLVQAFANEAAIAIENARLFQQVQLLAITDPLTGIFNRRYFFEIGGREFRRSVRHHHSLALVLIDIDHFKQFNDLYGHLAGDMVLREIGKESQKYLRESDIFARFGGEEFVLLLPETTAQDAFPIAERLRTIINELRVDVGGEKVFVSVSMGVAERGSDTNDLYALFENADRALYAAKEQGRGRVTIWDSKSPIHYSSK